MTADLAYGSNPGCVARVSTPGGAPGQCGGAEVAAVPHKYRHPWPHWTRLYVCSVHQAEHDDTEPLTVEDRQIIAERHERRRDVLAATGRLNLIGEGQARTLTDISVHSVGPVADAPWPD